MSASEQGDAISLEIAGGRTWIRTWDLCEARRTLLDKAGTPSDDIDAISSSGQMMGVVPPDKHGEPLRPAIIWADTRSTAESDFLVDRIAMDVGYRITGHRLNPTYSLSKIMWLRANEQDNFARIATVLQAKDYMVYRLTGMQVTDPSDASSTNAYDQTTGTWSDQLLDAAGLDQSLFPEIVPSTTLVGTVTADAAAETGLKAGIPVVLGGSDGPVAALGGESPANSRARIPILGLLPGYPSARMPPCTTRRCGA